MKYLLNVCLLLFISVSGFSQRMEASIGAGSSARRVIIYIKPTVAVNGNISTLQFDVAIPATITPIPVISIIGVPPIGSGWVIQPTYVEGSYRHYEILTASVFTVNIGIGAETPVMELEFTGGPVTTDDVSLVTLPAGGSTGNAIYFCSGALNSIEGFLYYPRSGTTVLNNNSYTGPDTSYARVSNILLPVTWLYFTAVKQGNNGLLSWTVANEDDNHHYELQRSTNGTDFTTIATINRSSGNGGVYSYTDVGLNNLGPTIFFYRVKQVEISGKTSNSNIRFITMVKKGTEITIFPNPVKDGFYVNVPLTGMDKEKVKLSLFASNGQLVATKEITGLQANNYYFDLKDKKLAGGQYSLQVIVKDKMIASKMLTINQ